MAELTYEAVLVELDEQIKGITEEQAGSGAAREDVFQEAATELEMAAVVAPAGTGHLLAAALLALYDERNARLAALKVIEEYESHSIEQDDRLANLAADLLETRAQLNEVRTERDSLLNEVERLRTRIHEAVDESNRRHAPYVSRCQQFDVWSAWAREQFEREGEAVNGNNFWGMTSEANRLLILSWLEERDAARAEVSRLRVELEATQDDRDEALHGVRHWQAVADEMEGDIQRYRQAWLSARQRASNHFAALVDADEERDALRAELREREP